MPKSSISLQNRKNTFAGRQIKGRSGMSNRKSGSNQFPLRRSPRFSLRRRSPRLLGKPADSTQKPKKPAAANRIQYSTRKPSKRLPRKPETASYVPRGSSIDKFLRWGRKTQARRFRNDYRYDDSKKEKRVYINSSGETTTWMDRSAGCTWVAVHRGYTICVALRGGLDMDRFRIIKQKSLAHRLFGINVLSEIEDIANSTEDSRQTMDNPVNMPFAVVSWIPSTTNDGQESGDDEASGAVDYLKEKMKKGVDFTETIQTAISGLVRVFSNEEVKANEIWVYVLGVGIERYLLPEEIMWHLSVIKTNEIEVQHILDMEHSDLS